MVSERKKKHVYALKTKHEYHPSKLKLRTIKSILPIAHFSRPHTLIFIQTSSETSPTRINLWEYLLLCDKSNYFQGHDLNFKHHFNDSNFWETGPTLLIVSARNASANQWVIKPRLSKSWWKLNLMLLMFKQHLWTRLPDYSYKR